MGNNLFKCLFYSTTLNHIMPSSSKKNRQRATLRLHAAAAKPLPTPASPLPTDWTTVSDPAITGSITGRSYYWNKKTNETTWTRPGTASSVSFKPPSSDCWAYDADDDDDHSLDSKKPASQALSTPSSFEWADENDDPYETFNLNMDDIKTMTLADVILGLHLRGLPLTGNTITLKWRLRLAFNYTESAKQSPSREPKKNVVWHDDHTVSTHYADNPCDDHTTTVNSTLYKAAELARRITWMPLRPTTLDPSFCQKIDPAYKAEFLALRPDLKSAPGIIEDIHADIHRQEHLQFTRDDTLLSNALNTINSW